MNVSGITPYHLIRAGRLLVSGCMFRKHSPNATLYKGDRTMLTERDNLLEGFENAVF